MSEHTRFCVLFGSSEDGQPAKTRLMYSDSSRDDLIEIGKQMYNVDDVPVDAELVNEDCVYRLDDDNDIAAFLAQAEDQYRLMPSQPLRVLFVASHRYCKNINTLPILNYDVASPSTKSPATVPEQMEMVKQDTNIPTDLSKGVRIDVNINNNDGHHRNQCVKPSSDSRQSTSYGSKEFVEDSNQDQHSPWSPANSLLMLYNRYRGQEKMKNVPKLPEIDSRTVGGVIDKITSSSTSSNSSKFSGVDSVNRYNGCDSAEYPYGNPYATYSNHLADSLGRPSVSFAPASANTAENSLSGISANMPNQALNLSAYSAFINGLQERKQMTQGNPNASYILQTLFNNHIKGNLSMPGQQQPGYSNINGNSPSRNLLASPSNLITSPEFSASTSAYQTGRHPSLLSTLAQYNNSSLLNYINGAAMTSLQNGVNSEHSAADFSKKTPKRRKRNGRLVEDDKSSDPSKRMRSSISQSNIEYHYQRAVDYSQMEEEDQKLQNSAHKSHWKHLLFVAKISPKFLEQFKHAKYDEWSSESRDIYAMCQPDKYMWSFLTLSKQGDMLCKRLTARIGDLMGKSADDRPDWCPDDEVLLRAQTRARERLGQLQRILHSRSVNQEAKAVEKAHELEKLSMQGKHLALMTTYHRGQQDVLRNQQSFIKDTGNFRQHTQQENSRPSTALPANQTIHCSSSVTSSPLSVASPAFEENNSAGSGCSESPVLQRTEGNLVIAEERELSHSPEPVGNVGIKNTPSLPYAATTASPRKWSSKVEGVADA